MSTKSTAQRESDKMFWTVIIGLLISAAIFCWYAASDVDQRQKSAYIKVHYEIGIITSKAIDYRLDKGSWPGSLADLTAEVNKHLHSPIVSDDYAISVSGNTFTIHHYADNAHSAKAIQSMIDMESDASNNLVSASINIDDEDARAASALNFFFSHHRYPQCAECLTHQQEASINKEAKL